jgi:hypothetical protein
VLVEVHWPQTGLNCSEKLICILPTTHIIKSVKHKVTGVVQRDVHFDTTKLRKLHNKQARKDYKVMQAMYPTSHRRLVLDDSLRKSRWQKKYIGDHVTQFQNTILPRLTFQLIFQQLSRFVRRFFELVLLPGTTNLLVWSCSQICISNSATVGAIFILYTGFPRILAMAPF